MTQRLKPNYIAILPDKPIESVLNFEIGDMFNPHLHKKVTGTVVAMCDKLCYWGYKKLKLPTDNEYDLAQHREISEHTLEWDTDLDVQIGDKVYFRLVNILEPNDPKYYDFTTIVNGETAILMQYSELIAKIECENLVPLNGYVLVEPIINNNNIGTFEVPSSRSITEGVVKFVGKPNRHYLFYPELSDDLDLKVGDRIAYPKTAPVRLETEGYRQFGEFTALDRIQRRNIYEIK